MSCILLQSWIKIGKVKYIFVYQQQLRLFLYWEISSLQIKNWVVSYPKNVKLTLHSWDKYDMEIKSYI